MNAARYYALSMALTTSLLCGCSGSSVPVGVTAENSVSIAKPAKSETFEFTGRRQTFVVPGGVTKLTVVVRGAAGGGETGRSGYRYFGRGGRVYAVIPVQSGEKLYVFVGGQGRAYLGGFNGGGPGGRGGTQESFGGGGASDVREGGTGLRHRILVAGGGGAQGVPYDAAFGGKGGGSIGGAGGDVGSGASGLGGAGGTQSQGGSGGAGGQGRGESNENGQAGGQGIFGDGGSGGNGGFSYSAYPGGSGGGAGGGYYGGGAGGGGGASNISYDAGGGGGGGGGSSYVAPSAVKFQSWQGWKNAIGNGLVVISWQ